MWIVCEVIVSDTDSYEEDKDPLLRQLQMQNIEEDTEWKDFCFNTSQVMDFVKGKEEGTINIFYYNGSVFTIKYDFEEMVKIKMAEDPTIVYTA